MTALPFTDFTDIMERAARNGTKAHLPAEVVRAAILHPAYAEFLTERIKELAATWTGPLPPASNSDPIGSNTEPNGTTGASAGTIPPLVHDAAERLALEAAEAAIPRKRRGKR